MNERRVIQPEDLYNLSALSEPQISSHSRYAAVIVTTLHETSNSYGYSVHLFDLQSGQSTVIESPGGIVRQLKFCPEGTMLAWIQGTPSKQESVVIIDVVRAFDRMAGQHTPGNDIESPNVSDSLLLRTLLVRDQLGQTLIWGHDSKVIYVTSVESNLPEIKVYQDVQFKADGIGLLPDVRTHVWEVALEGNARLLHSVHGPIQEVVVAPTGEELALVVRQSSETGLADTGIDFLQIKTGNIRRVVDHDGPMRAIAVAPDGKSIAWLGYRGGFGEHVDTVWCTSLNDGSSHEVLQNFDRPATMVDLGDVSLVSTTDNPRFSADGHSIYFLAQDGGETHVYKSAWPIGQPIRVTDGPRCVNHFHVSATGDVLFVSSTPTCAGELYLLRDGQEVQLTGLNSCSDLEFATVTRLNLEGAEGWPIEGWLALPPKSTTAKTPLPLVLFIHGGPHNAFGYAFNMEIQTLCAAGMAVLYVNPRGSQAYGTEFAEAVTADWGGKDYEDLMKAVDHVVTQGIADPERLGVTGYSYGGFMTTWIVGHTQRFRSAAAGGCVSNLISFHGTSDIGFNWGAREHQARVWENHEDLWRQSPIAFVSNVTTPILLYHAEGDDRCPIGQSEEYFIALRAQNKNATFVRYPGKDHLFGWTGAPALRVDRLSRVRAWFIDGLGIAHGVEDVNRAVDL